MKRWMVLMLLGAGLLFGSVFGFYAFKQKMISQYIASMPVPTASVVAIEVESSDWTPTIGAIGFIEPERGVTLSTSVSGLVSQILFESGQQVEKGALLLKLDSVKEQADLRSSEGRMGAVESDLERLLELASKGVTTRNQIDAAEAEYFALRGQIDSLKATIARREIRAPFSGIVGIRQANLGQYLQAGTDVVRLENMGVMRIRFIVGERDLARIAVGMPIKISVDAYRDRTFGGKISAIEPTVDYKTGMVQVQASIPNSDRLLRTGMYAQVQISQPTLEQQVVIPQSAINFTLYGESVYVLDRVQLPGGGSAYDSARLVTVRVAERRGSQALIAEGLQPGDRVVTSGQLKLSSGSHVKVVDDDTLAPPAELPRR